MTLFKNQTHQEVWQQRWCGTCFQPDEAARRLHGKNTQCPIWAHAISTGRKPVQWDRMARADQMDRTIRCNTYQDSPSVTRRPVAENEGVPLFDDTPFKTDVGFVPVDGWPEKPRKKHGTDHA